MSCPPRYGTRRRPDRPTTGPAVTIIARSFGYDLLPWQAHTLDVAGELDRDGLPAYSTVIVSVGRRAGKSLVAFAALLNAALTGRRRRAWYTAQSRADAALTFRDEWSPTVEQSPLAPWIRSRLANGSEAFTIPRHASTIRVFAPTPTALHGQAGDLIMFDEAWSHTAVRGAELEVAARPLMATRPGAQQWILSAAGDIDSTWWTDWLDRGRAAVEADVGTGICHLEWSADYDGADLDDEAVWIASHPAVRTVDNPGGTISLDWLRAEHSMNPAAFVRTYLNVTDRAGTAASPFDLDAWHRLAVDGWDRAGRLVAAVDASPEQTASTIVAAGTLDDGRPVVEVVDSRPGHGWVTDRLVDLVDTWGLETVALDRGGPAGVLYPELEAAGVPVVDLTLRDVTAAAAAFLEAVRTGGIGQVPSPLLDQAVIAARRRPIGDGSWTFHRTGSTVDVAPLIAATLAAAALRSPIPAVHG